jgi:hypothetical protein
LTKPDEQKICFHYTNLQPLWGVDNVRKSDSFDEDQFEWEWDGEEWIKIE